MIAVVCGWDKWVNRRLMGILIRVYSYRTRGGDSLKARRCKNGSWVLFEKVFFKFFLDLIKIKYLINKKNL